LSSGVLSGRHQVVLPEIGFRDLLAHRPKKAIVLVLARGVFQGIVLAHREGREVLHVEDAFQIRDARSKVMPEEIPGLALHPVRGGPQVGEGGEDGVGQRACSPSPGCGGGSGMLCRWIHHAQFLLALCGEVHAAQRGEEVEVRARPAGAPACSCRPSLCTVMQRMSWNCSMVVTASGKAAPMWSTHQLITVWPNGEAGTISRSCIASSGPRTPCCSAAGSLRSRPSSWIFRMPSITCSGRGGQPGM
jgi:hypothetical protein